MVNQLKNLSSDSGIDPLTVSLGQKLPWPEYTKPGDYSAVILNENAFDVVISLSGLSAEEESAIAEEEFEVFIARSELVPFMVFRFGKIFKCDLSVNIRKMKPEYVENWFHNDETSVNIYLLEGRTATVEAIRVVPFPEMASVKQACSPQLNRSKEEVDNYIRAIYSRWSIEDIMSKASVRFTVDEALTL